ncbi:MAG: ATP-dependent DNA helicase RecQ [Prevotella sp.]|nr:ATP-dependent DNA helicase RecQ [Prevotella sp.]
MTDKYLQILKQYWGFDNFRGIQRDIVESIGSGKDTLGLMPTGGGKSITFQVPALAQEGVCIVITPLIALMKDQVQHLRNRGIMAAAIYSGMSRPEIVTTLENCILGDTKLLYVSPERIASPLFITKLGHMKVSFITVDEAHCISQWGYDFRPSYLHIADIRRLKPDAPVLALTATATHQVIEDIQDRLSFSQKNVFRMSFERKNLAYVVRETEDKIGEMTHILQTMTGCSIVYVRSRKQTKEISDLLNKNNISATFYHAGLEPRVKDERQKLWSNDEVRVMVATNAFGMGIDKPDVRMVIHITAPSSIEAYFQEAGRAGRDGQKAYAVLLHQKSDNAKLRKRIDETFPDKEYIREAYNHIAYYYQIATGSGAGYTNLFDIDRFCRNFHHFPTLLLSALKILQRAGYIECDMDPDASCRLMFLVDRDKLYRIPSASENEERLLNMLLRTYSGLFTDYAYIDDELLAHRAGLTRQQVYLIFKSLNQRHIIHFIPQRKLPTITYTVDRVDGDQLILGPDVYDDRKEQFTKRIEAVIAYANNQDQCRSRQLLAYFDEQRTTDCGMCDVCIDHKRQQNSEQRVHVAQEKIMQLLADGQQHDVKELTSLQLHADDLREGLGMLIDEEKIHAHTFKIWKA